MEVTVTVAAQFSCGFFMTWPLLNLSVFFFVLFSFMCFLLQKSGIRPPFPKFLVAQTVKNLPAMQETQIRSLGQEDPLEEGMATHSSILAWRIPWTEEPGRLQSTGSQRVGHDWATVTYSLNLSVASPPHCAYVHSYLHPERFSPPLIFDQI